MRLSHPSTAKLQRWLDTGDPVDLGEHVERCARCSTRMEELATPTPELRSALSTVLAAPPDLVPRLDDRITEAMRTRGELRLLGEMLGVSWQTARLLLATEDDPPDARPSTGPRSTPTRERANER